MNFGTASKARLVANIINRKRQVGQLPAWPVMDNGIYTLSFGFTRPNNAV